MGTPVSVDYTAMNYGYVSPRMRGRVDLDFYDQSLDYLLNYIVTPQGEACYRAGGIFVSATRQNKKGRLIPFLYNTEQSYQLELTDQYMRFYKDHGLITDTAQAITGVTQASPGVLTYVGTDPANGDPFFLEGISGMHQLNGMEVRVANVNAGANTFELQDSQGNNINTTAFSAYTAGGTMAKIIEIATPFLEAELFELEYTQTNDTMYLTHRLHQPVKLTRGGSHTSWTIGTFNFIGNPFGTTKAAAKTITAATAANPVVITSAGHGYTNGQHVLLSKVVGMTQLNGKTVTVQNVTLNTFECQDLDGSAFSTYVSGGQAELWTAFSWPSLVTLFDGRLIYAASDAYPTRIWFSKGRADGLLDDFTLGALAADAIVYNLRADQANRIRWIIGAENYMALGTSGSEYRVSGGGADNDTITPTNISVKPASFNGVAATRPVRLDSYILYAQRNGRTVRSFEYNALKDGYTSPDRTLLADHIGKSKFKQFSYTTGNPNIIWGVRNDGKLVGLTFDPDQQVIAWHPHNTDGLYTSISTIPEADDDDELWQIVERVVNGRTVRYVEYIPNTPEIPVMEDFFTGEDNKDADLALYETALWNTQKTIIHSDSSLVYDGRDVASVNLTITGGTTGGSVVTVTASAVFFSMQMATDRRRIQSPYGGQIEITGFTSSTVVTGRVLYDLEATTFAAYEWYYMAIGLGGLSHLEGKSIRCLADGGVLRGKTVVNGMMTLDEHAGYVIVGLGYFGIGKLQSIEGGTRDGRSQTREKTITDLGVRVRNTLGTKFGTSLYSMSDPAWRSPGDVAGRPPRLVDGVFSVPLRDGGFKPDMNIYFLHDNPVPSNIQYIRAGLEAN